MISSIKIGNVKLLPSIFYDRAKLNIDYLLSLDNVCLLQNYYIEAGIILPGLTFIGNPENAKLHWGWESTNCQLRGHFLGHWLSAAAMSVSVSDNPQLKGKIDFIIEELDRCQKYNGGKWLAPIPEKYFIIMETGRYIWSPQYTMHKLILGLIHVYVYAGNRKALTLLNNLADWYVKWTDKVLKGDHPEVIYKGEQGGMLEVWTDLFALTGKAKYETLMQRYINPSIFDDLLAGKDCLSDTHQNASIPYIHGAAKLYETTGDKKYYDILEKFWEIGVEKRGYYCTGGQGAGEFWIPMQKTGTYMGERNQEFCTVYNMVRVADYLFKFSGNAKYLDYIEQNLYNGFLAQQNKFTGMPTYFLPMKSGGVKTWGSPKNDFWCCHGTMVQAQTIYQNLCYYQKEGENRIYVAQYIPSEAEIYFDEDKKNKVVISQNVNMKYYDAQALFDDDQKSQDSRWLLRFTVKANCEFTLSFRIPNWIAERPTVTVNGTEIDIPTSCDKCGFLNIKKNWSDDEVIVYLPAALTTVSLPDKPEKVAFKEGPIVLAGISDNDYGIKISDNLEESFDPVKEHTYSTFPWLQSTYTTKNQDKETMFKPLYEVTDEKYTLYWSKK